MFERIEQESEGGSLFIESLTIVFDIDDVLACQGELEASERLYFIRKSGVIIAADNEHQVMPGSLELLRWLLSKPYIKIAFFSSGAKERNDEFVHKLLTLALGEESAGKILTSTRILSRQDLTPGQNESANQMDQLYGPSRGNNKKDITKALDGSSDLARSILIDDDGSYINPGQERNFLLSPNGKSDELSYFSRIYQDKEEYDGCAIAESFWNYNTIFYLAGVLRDCLEIHESGGSVTDHLFAWHFEKSDNRLFGYKPRYSQLKDMVRYQRGLEVMRDVNPSLNFVTVEDFISLTESPVTDLEQAIIDECGVAKNDQCCVM